jgi:flagellar basal-body rod protein FlgB
MDMRLMRQNIVASNLANIETEGYTERRLEFEKDLQSALNLDAKGKMTRTTGRHLPAVFDANTFGPKLDKDIKHRVIYGEDNVDMDKEMSVMAKNTLMYNALTTVLSKNFQGLTTIISEGSR